MSDLTIEDVFDRKKDNTQRVPILLDPDLREQLKDLEAELADAEQYDNEHTEARKKAPAVEKLLDKLEVVIADSRVTFKFKSIGREAYSKLLDEFKPREDNEDDEDVGFDIDEFPPHLLALSAVEPPLTLVAAYKVWNEFSDSETTLLVAGALTANKELVDIPFTRSGTRMGTFSTASPSTTAQDTDSPTPSS